MRRLGWCPRLKPYVRIQDCGTTDESIPHRFLTIEQAAEDLNVKANQIRFLIKSGDLRGIRIGARGVWCIGAAGLIQDVEDYIAEAHRRTAERIAAGEVGEDMHASEA